MHKLDVILFGFGGRISANTTGLYSIISFTPAHTQPRVLLVYYLVIMEAIDGLSSETIISVIILQVQDLQTADFCGTKPRATIKTTT